MMSWQVDEMYERESARKWEELNAPDPCEGQMIEAAMLLDHALSYLSKALDLIGDAASELSETPMAARVESFIDTIENEANNLRELQEKYSHGNRD